MLTAARLDQMRAAQEAVMTSTGTITRDGNKYEFVDGQERLKPAETVYEGRLRIQRKSTAPLQITAGAEQVPNPAYIGAAPWHVTGLRVGDVLTVTEAGDPELAGLRFLITDVERNGLALTARRFHANLLP